MVYKTLNLKCHLVRIRKVCVSIFDGVETPDEEGGKGKQTVEPKVNYTNQITHLDRDSGAIIYFLFLWIPSA